MALEYLLQKDIKWGWVKRKCPGREERKDIRGHRMLSPQSGVRLWGKLNHYGRKWGWNMVCGQTLSSLYSLALWDRLLHVALGKHNLRRWEATQQVLRVVRQVPHPQYRPQAHDNDLMLLKLQRKVRLGRAVRTIPVARSCASPGTPCRVSGWGTTASPIGKEPSSWKCKAGPLGLREEADAGLLDP